MAGAAGRHSLTMTAAPNIEFEVATGFLAIDGARVLLTPREAQVMGLLVRRFGRPVAHESFRVVGIVDGDDACKQGGVLSVFVHRINRKCHGRGIRIVSRHGFGYELVRDDR
jgi:DNA-binding response OmpR family regulator